MTIAADPVTVCCRNHPARPVCGDKGGPYVRLCEQCKQDAIAAKSIPPRDRVNGVSSATFEARAQALVAAGRVIDERIEQVRLLSAQRRDALAMLGDAVEHWQRTCQRLERITPPGSVE